MSGNKSYIIKPNMLYYELPLNAIFKKMFIIFLSSYLLSCAATNSIKSINHKNQIASFINSSIKKYNLPMSLSINITSLNNQERLYALNNEKLFTPASTVKLFTSLISMDHFKKDHTFKTSILKKNNNLYLVGGADPSLTFNELDSMAIIVSKFVNKVDTLFLDDRILDSLNYGRGWMWDEGSGPSCAPVGGLTLNNNCVDFIIARGLLHRQVEVNTIPRTDYVRLINLSRTVENDTGQEEFKVERDWVNQTNQFIVSGELPINSHNDTISRNIFDPTSFTGFIFSESLQYNGLEVKNIVRQKENHNSLDTILTHKSKPISQIIKDMQYKSNNLIAETLIKSVGLTDTSSGSWNAGLHKLKGYLSEQINFDTTRFRIVDGSGLSRYNLLSTDQVVKLLVYVYNSKFRQDFIMSLPTGGEIGSSLEKRLQFSKDKLYAKTGSLSGVSCLSGYAFSPKYGPLAFSIIINGFVGDIKPYRRFQDEICSWLTLDL